MKSPARFAASRNSARPVCGARQGSADAIADGVVVEGVVRAVAALWGRVALWPGAVGVLRLQQEGEAVIERLLDLGVLRLPTDAHQKAKGALGVVIVEGGGVAPPGGFLRRELSLIASEVPAAALLLIKVDPIVPSARLELPPGKRPGGGTRGLQIALVARRAIGAQERLAYRRGARRLDPNLRRRGLSLSPALLQILGVPPQIAALGSDLRREKLHAALQ